MIFPIGLLALLRAVADITASSAVHELFLFQIVRKFSAVKTVLDGRFGGFGRRPVQRRVKFRRPSFEFLARIPGSS